MDRIQKIHVHCVPHILVCDFAFVVVLLNVLEVVQCTYESYNAIPGKSRIALFVSRE